jgi:hypothetical protein
MTRNERADETPAEKRPDGRLYPDLAGLFPYLSHYDLLLSRTTGYPFIRDTRCIRPLLSGGYAVMWPETMERIATVQSPRPGSGDRQRSAPWGIRPCGLG